jgi:hypothetical protein
MRAICPFVLIIPYLFVVIISGQEYELRSFPQYFLSVPQREDTNSSARPNQNFANARKQTRTSIWQLDLMSSVPTICPRSMVNTAKRNIEMVGI